jgi:hypothetical protein
MTDSNTEYYASTSQITWTSVLQQFNKINRNGDYFPSNTKILSHPNNIKDCFINHDSDKMFGIFGLDVFIDKHIPETAPIGKVKFPNWRFCEFEEKDEGWALALGIASREEVPVVYAINNKYKHFELNLLEEVCSN